MLKRYTGGEWVEQGGGGGTNDYADLSNKPKINNTTLSRNKTSSDLGLQPAINGSAKVNADYIDDSTSTNKFVTASDKINWNAKLGPGDTYTKQELDDEFTAIDNAIDAVEAGAAAGATALQPEDVSSTYSSSGTAPINGTGVAAALSTLDVPAVGGSGKYISQISEVDGKIEAIPQTMDSTPTEESYKAISSDGVWADQQRQEVEIGAVANRGAKNLFKNTAVSKTYLGVTFTVNEDGTVSLSGAATTAAGVLEIGTITPPAGSYIVSGCPEGGSWAPNPNKYRIRIAKNGTWLGDETGTGYTVTVNGSDVISLQINSGVGVDTAGLVFKPMIRPASITDSTFQPYGKTNAELTVENTSQQSEINYAVNTGVKNLFDINTSLPLKIYHTTYTLSDGSLTVTSNGNWGHHSVPVNLPAGNYIFTATISNFSKDSSASATSVRMRVTDTTATGGIEIASKAVTGNGAFELPFTWTGGQCYIQYYPNYTSTTTYVSSFTASDNMVRRAEITDPTYEPYALPNPVLTPALIEQIDSGAKNLVDTSTVVSGVVTFTQDSDYYVTASPTNTDPRVLEYATSQYKFRLPAGNYVLSMDIIETTSQGDAICWVFKSDGTNIANKSIKNLSGLQTLQFALSAETDIGILLKMYTAKLRLMVCTESYWAVSQKFVPYAPTNRELYEDLQTKVTLAKVFGRGVGISNNDDLNTYQTLGRYCASNGTIAASLSNCPVTTGFVLTVTESFQVSGGIVQTIETLVAGETQVDIYKRMRIYRNNAWAWGDWYKFEGTAVT